MRYETLSKIEKLFETYSSWDSFEVLENANKYPCPTGYFAHVAEEALGEAVQSVIPKEFYRLHEEGVVYIHKLPYSIYIPYCTGHSIARVLSKGLRTPTAMSRPARHFDTFVDHVANYLITMQHFFTGAQALSAVEWYAGPFIRNDRLSYREVKQNVQRLIFNLNYPSRIGFQSSFTNFTVILDAARQQLKELAVYDGKPVEPLENYSGEAVLFIKALAEVLLEGDATGQPFTFPIPTLMTSAKMIWDNPELFEAIFTAATRRGSFYWLNTRVVDPDAVYAMCCRLSIRREELMYANSRNNKFRLSRKDAESLREEYIKNVERAMFGGVWAVPDITGSINVVDVNLPRLALMARGDDGEFWELYDQALTYVRALGNWFRHRYIYLITKHPNVYSLLLEYMPEFPSFHFNTIGIIGLPEAVAILMQNPKLWLDGSRSEWIKAADLMRRIVEYATKKAREWMMEEGVPWNVEEVPGESAAAKLAMKDLRLFPELAEYLPDPMNPIYSTSIAPYYAPMELHERVEVESAVQKYFTGGVMMHIFLGEEPDPEGLASLTKKLTQTELVYWSYTPALTWCPKCGKSYTGLYNVCPKCGSAEVEVWSRIVGYYRPLKQWNPYRRKEFTFRKHYTV